MGMFTLVLIAAVGLLIMGYVYGSATKFARLGIVAVGVLVSVGTYVDIHLKEAAAIARLQAEEDARKKAAAVAAAKQKAERERLEQEQAILNATIKERLPNSHHFVNVNLQAQVNNYIHTQRECMLDNLSTRRMRGITRSVSLDNRKIYYQNANRYGLVALQIMFFDDLAGSCAKSIALIAQSGYISNSIFNNRNFWSHATRVLRPGQAGVRPQNRQRPQNTADVKEVMKQGIEGLVKQGLDSLFKK